MADEGGGAVRQADVRSVIEGGATLAAGLLAFAAFDDITTDNAASFAVEYAVLLVCGGWLLILAARLAWRGRRALAGLSLALLLSIVWGQRAIGPGTRAAWQAEYVIATVALVGVFAVGTYLVLGGIRHGWRAAA